MSNDESAPYPGIQLDMKAARPIIDKFVKTYRRNLYSGMPDNVPTACTLNGKSNSNIIYSKTFRLIKKLYVLFESPDELYISSGEDVLRFYDNLEPWEDYDFCVYDDTLNWCIGVTHNEDVIVIDKTGVFSEFDKDMTTNQDTHRNR